VPASCRRLLLCWVEQRLHDEVTPLSPFGRGDVSESRRGQHQCRVPIREGSDHPGPPSDFADDPFEWIVGSDLPPMCRGIGIVGQRLLDLCSTSSAAAFSFIAFSRVMISAAFACAAFRSSWAWIALSIRATSATLPFGTWLKTFL
jgi:hypothetical protein